MSGSEETPEAQLLREVGDLGVDDILALCYAFSHRSERLRLYIDVLRKRSGERSQFASCLICFDLASKGDTAAQRDFHLLAPTIRELCEKRDMIQSLLGDDEYLNSVWKQLDDQIQSMDTRFETDHAAEEILAAQQPVVALDLLDEVDLAEIGDFDLIEDDFDVRALHEHFVEVSDRFFGRVADLPAYYPEAGFRLGHRRDVDRIEVFLKEMESLGGRVPAARGLKPFLHLFYGAHMRSKTFLGGFNARKQRALREGIREFKRAVKDAASDDAPKTKDSDKK